MVEKWLESGRRCIEHTLEDQQLTAEDIPVIMDKCLKFVTSIGCLTQGIYRLAGINSRIARLLESFRHDAWGVNLDPNEFSEHDVANAIKRFFRTLHEPLMTQSLRSTWIQTSHIEQLDNKLKWYKYLLTQLPGLNYGTLRRLIVHLRAISEQQEDNSMPVSNLAALWGPTILTVDGQGTFNFNQTTAEVTVITDLIEHYEQLFDININEEQQEQDLLEALKERPNIDAVPATNSGDIKVHA